MFYRVRNLTVLWGKKYLKIIFNKICSFWLEARIICDLTEVGWHKQILESQEILSKILYYHLLELVIHKGCGRKGKEVQGEGDRGERGG